MERDRQPLVDLVLVLQHIAAAHEGRPASGVDGVGDFHTAFTRENTLQVHIEPRDAHGGCGYFAGPVEL